MTNSPGNPEPTSVKNLNDPLFLAWLKGRLRGRTIEPDDQDYDFQITRPMTNKEADQALPVSSNKETDANVWGLEGRPELIYFVK